MDDVTSRVRIGSVTLAVEDVGEGAPLLLVHGFPLSRRMWAPQCGALHGAWRCLAPDLRGFGESGATPPFSVDQWADDLAAMLDEVGAREPVVLCGLSMGGYVAFAFWRRHRERVRALVLADTRPDADTPEGIERRRRTIAVARERGSASVATLLEGGMLGATTRERRPEIAALVRAMIAATPVEGIVGASEAMIARPDSTDLLGTIDVPTLVVVGEEDTISPPDVARAMHAAIPTSRLEVIPGAGHLTTLERPAAFNCVLGDWLDSLDPLDD
jgi:pimeloyl-ACP methyl ester carboxylesterase